MRSVILINSPYVQVLKYFELFLFLLLVSFFGNFKTSANIDIFITWISILVVLLLLLLITILVDKIAVKRLINIICVYGEVRIFKRVWVWTLLFNFAEQRGYNCICLRFFLSLNDWPLIFFCYFSFSLVLIRFQRNFNFLNFGWFLILVS